MIEAYFTATHVLDRMRSCPMARYLNTLDAELRSQEYSRKSIRWQIRYAPIRLALWLTEQDLTVAVITDDLVKANFSGLHRSSLPRILKGYRPHNAQRIYSESGGESTS